MDTPRLVASDIDGTLLDPYEQLTVRTLSAITRVRAAGAPFVLVSGRPPRWIPPVAEAAGLDGYAVCANGAIVYDIGTGEIVTSHGLDPLLLADVTHALEKVLPGIQVATERAVSGQIPGREAFATEAGYSNPWGDVENNTKPRAEVLGHPATKLLVRHQGMTSAEMALAAVELLGESVDVTYSTNRGLIEIAAPGVTKASGLAEVAALAGVEADRVVAFGDMPNDIEMLRWAGLGVAMSNAHDDVKAAADEVAGSNADDGVAEVLERWF
ncbi:Cof-type HAD-IIB family hydrolase [Actinokineospora sp. PR83]|uniref:HAD family hydrolase n=1 Tax=Actinokineospora sp. PR83 TaxID=2884908 RepID=UPI0027DFCAB9|nr:Cof-type HAD-IIB family hydrolase [Actinokineospora sp. PR83]MCG8914855.1 Cof-type HAD-IIB family hydrolase [Actinokineospora sp. PR83]